MLQLLAPPLPTLLAAGEHTFDIGESHINRNNIGVFDLLVVTKGQLHMGEDYHKFQVCEGKTLILSPDRHHFSISPCDQVTHFFWFHFITSKGWKDLTISKPFHNNEKKALECRNVFSENPFGITLPKFCQLSNPEAVERLCSKIITSENESIYSGEWQRQVLFQQLLQELSNHLHLANSMPALAVAEKAAVYLRKNYAKKITYEDLGHALRFHPNHIARCMIQALGCTPIEYVNKIRMDQAKILLVSTDWNIDRISESCGFTQSAYFSRTFKKLEGLSPNQFRKQYIGKIPINNS
ncbi:helix-turn-helix transcriptional regulator [Bacillus sp. ISL-75]|jgi:AraC-like DNA-binding protein|uniref:helix-turn-helix transcriptional regulator n=1 Tax=Bacillus sp. ISL-75 TaxID=2819137 RepID=UPI001BEA2AE5|nr:AraC family transcriptional regulator [Bacillus sp. ISL-75]MBT2727336.1 helix-turn-helix transcriptional regulator [Bacillus sp. ISL-75]